MWLSRERIKRRWRSGVWPWLLDNIKEILEKCDEPVAQTDWEPTAEEYFDVKRFKEYMASHPRVQEEISS